MPILLCLWESYMQEQWNIRSIKKTFESTKSTTKRRKAIQNKHTISHVQRLEVKFTKAFSSLITRKILQAQLDKLMLDNKDNKLFPLSQSALLHSDGWLKWKYQSITAWCHAWCSFSQRKALRNRNTLQECYNEEVSNFILWGSFSMTSDYEHHQIEGPESPKTSGTGAPCT